MTPSWSCRDRRGCAAAVASARPAPPQARRDRRRDPRDRLFDGQSVGLHHHVGHAVEGQPGLVELGEALGRVGPRGERPLVGASNAFEDGLGGGDQADDGAEAMQRRAVVRVDEGAAAGRDTVGRAGARAAIVSLSRRRKAALA